MIEASDKSELVERLSKTDISVPGRSRGRTTFHRERYSGCRLAATLAEYDRLHYPFELLWSDKPDLVLTSGSEVIGLEVVEATDEIYSAFETYAEKEFPDASYSPSHFMQEGPERITKRNLKSRSKKILRGEEFAPGWEGDFPERTWVEAITEKIGNKDSLARGYDWDSLNPLWLLVYSNLPLHGINYEEARITLSYKMGEYFRLGGIFQRLFIMTDGNIFSFEPNNIETFTNSDIWKAVRNPISGDE